MKATAKIVSLPGDTKNKVYTLLCPMSYAASQLKEVKSKVF